MNNIKVSAINQAGRKVTATLPLNVVLPYIPTAVDTLCSGVWEMESSSFSRDNGANWIFEEFPVELQKWHIVFSKNGKYDLYLSPYTFKDPAGPWNWSIKGRKIFFTCWKDFILTDKKLILYFISISKDSNNIESERLFKEVYVR